MLRYVLGKYFRFLLDFLFSWCFLCHERKLRSLFSTWTCLITSKYDVCLLSFVYFLKIFLIFLESIKFFNFNFPHLGTLYPWSDTTTHEFLNIDTTHELIMSSLDLNFGWLTTTMIMRGFFIYRFFSSIQLELSTFLFTTFFLTDVCTVFFFR